MPSEFEDAMLALGAKMCKSCKGLGTCDDADCNDIGFNTWTCTACNGRGMMGHATTRDAIREFNIAFNRPFNVTLQESVSVSDRILLASILLEETIETIEKGLGLRITVPGWDNGDFASDKNDRESCSGHLKVIHAEGGLYDVIETADGLGDVNVVIHFIAHWLGMNLDAITNEIHNSNMSKLGEDGKPIINGVTPGYRDKAYLAEHNMGEGWADDESGFDSSKPVGKILKGPNFAPPFLNYILAAGNWPAHVTTPTES